MTTNVNTAATKIFDDLQAAKREAGQPEGSPPESSPPTANLYAAMANARAAMQSPREDGRNPHFKSKYVTLAGLLEAVTPALSANGIHIWQCLQGEDLQTIITHTSGERIDFLSTIPTYGDIQKLGSALTYMRRYTISSLLSISSPGPGEEDDGNSAMPGKPAPSKLITPEQAASLQALAEEVGADIPRLLKFCTAPDFERVPASKYASAISGLEAKRKS
tara:strand:- start:2325 stop:2984 length:660 start_codon:yes stop_codon:yes gene_type:complete